MEGEATLRRTQSSTAGPRLLQFWRSSTALNTLVALSISSRSMAMPFDAIRLRICLFAPINAIASAPQNCLVRFLGPAVYVLRHASTTRASSWSHVGRNCCFGRC